MTDSPSTVGDVIDLLRKAGVLAEIGMSFNHSGTMKTRGSIPVHWHARILAVSARQGLPINAALLSRLAKPAGRRPEGERRASA